MLNYQSYYCCGQQNFGSFSEIDLDSLELTKKRMCNMMAACDTPIGIFTLSSRQVAFAGGIEKITGKITSTILRKFEIIFVTKTESIKNPGYVDVAKEVNHIYLFAIKQTYPP